MSISNLVTTPKFNTNTSTPSLLNQKNTTSLNPFNQKFLNPQQSTTPNIGVLTPPTGSTSVGKVGTTGGYDTVPGTLQVPKPIAQSTIQPPTQSIGKPPIQNYASTTSPSIFTTPSGAQVTQSGQTLSAPQDVQSPVRGLFPDIASSLVNTANQVNPMTSESYRKAQELNKMLSESRKNQAIAEGQQGLAPIPIGDSTGRQAVTRNQYLAQQAAISSELQGESALAGIGQAQQNIQQSGLGTAGGLAKPQVTGFGQTTFDPTTGQFGGGSSNLDPNIVAKDLASKVLSGQLSYSDAISSLGYAGGAAQQFLNSAISAQNPGANINQLQGQSTANQQVVGQQTAQIAGYQSALQQGQNLQAQLSDLIQTFGLNPNDLNAANLGLQAIARNTSSPQYKMLQNYVNDIANTYAQILTPTGGSQTDTTRAIATSMLDETASGNSLLAVMHSLDEAAKAKIAGVSTFGNSNNTGGSQQNGSQGGLSWDNL